MGVGFIHCLPINDITVIEVKIAPWTIMNLTVTVFIGMLSGRRLWMQQTLKMAITKPPTTSSYEMMVKDVQ